MIDKNGTLEFFFAKNNLIDAVNTLRKFNDTKAHPFVFKNIKSSPYSNITKNHFILKQAAPSNRSFAQNPGDFLFFITKIGWRHIFKAFNKKIGVMSCFFY